MKALIPGHRYELANFEPNKAPNDVSSGLRKEAYELCHAIEACGCSEAVTKAVTLASALGDKIGDLESGNQILQFIHKVTKHNGAPGELNTLVNGTTNEEVLAVLIDRVNYLQSMFPCRENALAITKLEEALMWLNQRTANRMARGVEGTWKA